MVKKNMVGHGIVVASTRAVKVNQVIVGTVKVVLAWTDTVEVTATMDIEVKALAHDMMALDLAKIANLVQKDAVRDMMVLDDMKAHGLKGMVDSIMAQETMMNTAHAPMKVRKP
jgi:hypothetical protein